MDIGSSDPAVSAGLFAIFFIILLGPFLSKKIENNLEAFLLAMGAAALTFDHFMLEGVSASAGELAPNWNARLVESALVDPVEITIAVLAAGALFHYGRDRFVRRTRQLLANVPIEAFVFIVVVVLGLASSLVTAIIAALLLVEIVAVLGLDRATEVKLVVIGCFSIGLGAALTPVGEPLSTIVIRTKLDEGFWYLFSEIGAYIIPAVFGLGLLAALVAGKGTQSKNTLDSQKPVGGLRDVLMRGAKVYMFVGALVVLGTAFYPIIKWYIAELDWQALYWVNTSSAILDNATLASAEIMKGMSEIQIDAALMALLIAGGMLIPGNIPNIICANKLGITSREWARFGLPLGAALMLVFFGILMLA